LWQEQAISFLWGLPRNTRATKYNGKPIKPISPEEGKNGIIKNIK
jgi:hypothetical protein